MIGESGGSEYLRLSGRVMLVVGGTSGIGLSAVRALARAGASVVATGPDSQSVTDAARRVCGQEIAFFEADARYPDMASETIKRVVERFGRLDGLFHVAGGSGRSFGDGLLHAITDEGWRATLNLNLDSVFYSNRAAVRQFLAQRSAGSIVNMGSVLASSVSPRYFATHAYAAAKAAIEGFSRSVAATYAPNNIRVNVLAAGLVETPMAQRALSDAAIRSFVEAKQPLAGGRIVQPDDYESAAVFLLSDESRFMTGQTVVIDGGWSVSDGRFADRQQFDKT